MDSLQDIRWKQRLENCEKALGTIEKAVQLSVSRPLTDLEKQGLVQGFEFTFELSWNVMKDFLESEGITGIIGSRGAIRQAFSAGLISDGQVWLDMLNDRNLASHSYDEKTAENMVSAVSGRYYQEFKAFVTAMKARAAALPAAGVTL